jgi:hypothetical protein
MNVENGTVATQFLSGNICFEFVSVLVLCSVFTYHSKRTQLAQCSGR